MDKCYKKRWRKAKNKKAKKEKQMENTMYILTNRQSASTEYEISFYDFEHMLFIYL